MFEKSLADLVRGIRSHTDDEVFILLERVANFFQMRYISQCMDECRKELRLESKDVKANAIMKLTYVFPFLLYFSLLQLQMMGYDISWAAFNVGCSIFPSHHDR